MKKLLFLLLLGAATCGLGQRAQAQDKPVLNTAPPGAPVPAPTAPPDAPVPTAPPVAAPAPAPVAPAPQPTPDRPSGLDLPSDRDARAAGGGPSSLSDKLFIYSGFGLNFGSYNGYSQFFFSISPAVGYRLTDRIAIGPGISYAYSKYSFPANNPDINTSNIGVKVFGQARVVDQFYAHLEYELTRAQLLAVDNNGYLTGGTVSKLYETPLAGVAYRQQFSDRAAVDALLLYNFNGGFNSLYSNPVFRICFLFNLGR